MAIEAENVLRQALSLPEKERLSLAWSLLESVEPEVERAWEQEILKRIARIDEGTAVGRSWEEIKKDFHSQLGR